MSKVLIEYSDVYKIYIVDQKFGYSHEMYPILIEIELSDDELETVGKVFSDFNKCQEFLQSRSDERIKVLESMEENIDKTKIIKEQMSFGRYV